MITLQRIAMALLAAAVTACTSSESRYAVGPADTTEPDTGGGVVQRASLVVRVSSDIGDSSVLNALGWTTGAVPRVIVVIRRAGAQSDLVDTAGADGVVQFDELLTGSYAISTLRLLTESERARLGAGDADVDAFGGGSFATLQAPTTTKTVSAIAGRRGSVVISELLDNCPQQPSGNFYCYGHFVEIYNNSDTAIALADIMLVRGFPGGVDSPNFPCSTKDCVYRDTLGIWTPNVWAFPNHMLGPGKTAVVAVDAIDHTTIATGTYDLSSAEFEFLGRADVDNPGVPNMLDLGPNDIEGFLDHGWSFHDVREVIVLAERIDVATLQRRANPTGGDRSIVRIPAENVVDVLLSSASMPSTYPLCVQPVSPRFDRQEAFLVTPLDSRSVQRRVIGKLPDGRKVLLRTKTSARDFEAAAPTPFRIP